MQTLEQQLADICKANGMDAVSVELHFREDGTAFCAAFAHGYDDGARICGSSGSQDTARDAIIAAVANLNAKRVPSLAPIGEAA